MKEIEIGSNLMIAIGSVCLAVFFSVMMHSASLMGIARVNECPNIELHDK